MDVYVAGFLARCDAFRRPGQSLVDRPGVHGVISPDDPSSNRWLIDDDRAIDELPELLGHRPGGMLTVLATAPGVVDMLHGRGVPRGRPATAMITRDLSRTSTTALPLDLTVRAVRRTEDDPATDVPLMDAVVLTVRADPDDESLTTDALSAFLRGLPPTVRLIAAVDREGAVVGTAGVGVYGRYAHIILVNTEPDRRGEGVGRAMTGLALADARERGATAAYLDASDDGRRLYDGMGFETAAALTRFTYQT